MPLDNAQYRQVRVQVDISGCRIWKRPAHNAGLTGPQPEISTWTLTCLTQAGEGCRLIFEFGSFVGQALPKATDMFQTQHLQ